VYSANRITHSVQSTNLADILERVLDKGVVIAGDIKVCLADVELLSIKIRLVLASVDKALAIGINWWQRDPALSAGAALDPGAQMAARLAGAASAPGPLEPLVPPDPATAGQVESE
jgi:hypothetical protein